jgi:hypothetical protein
MISATSNTDDSARSPFAGCAILIIALLVVVFLVVFSTNSLFRQFREIEKFTSGKPCPVVLASVENKEAALNTLAERLESFRQALGSENGGSLALSPEDMNLAIAAYEPLKELRGTFHILSVDNDAMRIAISFQLNGKPRLARGNERGLVASDARYLNATLVAKPALLKNEVVLKIDTIEVPGASVPDGFTGQFSPYRITERYLNDAVIGPAMKKLTRVSLADGKLVLARVPGEIPADRITDEQVDSASSHLFSILGVVACVFLLIVGTVVFIGLWAKRRRTAN